MKITSLISLLILLNLNPAFANIFDVIKNSLDSNSTPNPNTVNDPNTNYSVVDNQTRDQIKRDAENWNRIILSQQGGAEGQSRNFNIIRGLQNTIGSAFNQNAQENLLMTIFNDVAGYSGTIPLFSFPTPGPATGFFPELGFGLGLNFEVRRKVFDNKLVIKDSFTVWDHLKIGLSPSVYGYGPGGISGGLSFMVNFGVDNWRQVTVGESEYWAGENLIKNVKNKIVAKTNEIKNKLGKTKSIDDLSDEESKHQEPLMSAIGNLINDSERAKMAKTWKGINSGQKKAIFSRLWNIFTMVGRIPLRANSVKILLAPDEVIQYTLEGGVNVSVALSTASSYNNAPLPSTVKSMLNQGIDFTAYLTGRFNVAIKRIPSKNPRDNFVLLKITKENDKGFKIGAGSLCPTDLKSLIQNGMDYTAAQRKIEGNLDEQAKLEKASGLFGTLGMPLQWVMDISKVQLPRYDYQHGFGRSNSRLYVYNLNTPEGRNAYNFAVFGFLSPSDKLATDNEGNVKHTPNGPVNFLMSLEEEKEYKNWLTTFQLAFLAKYEYNRREEFRDLILTDEDGKKYKSLIAELTESRKRSFMIGVDREERTHNIRVWLDQDRFILDKPIKESAIIDFFGSRDDFHTGIDELTSYAKDIESVLGLPGLVPRVPVELASKPILGGLKRIPKPSLGNFFMNYRGQYNENHLFKFLNTPKHEMWPIIFAAFDGERRGWKLATDDEGNVIDKKENLKNHARLAGQNFLWGISKFGDLVGTRMDKVNDYRMAKATYNLWKVIVCQFGTKTEKWPKCVPKKSKDKNEEIEALRDILSDFFNIPGYKSELLAIFRGSLESAFEANQLDRKTIPYSFQIYFPLLDYRFNYQNGTFIYKGDITNKVQETMVSSQKVFPPGMAIDEISATCLKPQNSSNFDEKNGTSKDCFFHLVFFFPAGTPTPDKLQLSMSFVPFTAIGSIFYKTVVGQMEINLKNLPPPIDTKSIPNFWGNINQEGKKISVWIDGKDPKSSPLFDFFKEVTPGPYLVSRYLITVLPLDKNNNQISDTQKMAFYVNYQPPYQPKENFDLKTQIMLYDNYACRGLSFLKIMAKLGNRHLRFCKKEDISLKDPFSCNTEAGEIPYPVANPNSKTLTSDAEKEARNRWLVIHCPENGTETNITLDEIKESGVCKKTALQTILALKENNLSICENPKIGDKCEKEIIPYPFGGSWNFDNWENIKENSPEAEIIKFRTLRSRNSFIYSHCLPIE